MSDRTNIQEGSPKSRSDILLREKDMQYRLAVETARDGFWIADVRGYIIDVNEALARMTGYTREELWKMHSNDLDPATPEQEAERIAELKAQNRAEFETQIRRRDGSTFLARSSVTFSSLSGGRFFTFIRDISQARANEELLARARRALTVLSDSNRTIHRAENEHELLKQICEIIVKKGGYYFAWVGYAETDANKTVMPKAHAGQEMGYLETANISWAENSDKGRGPTAQSIRSARPVVARDIRNDPAYAPWRDEAIARGYASSVSLPLITEGIVVGALCIYSHEPDAFAGEEVELLTELANDLAYAIAAFRHRAENEIAWRQIRRLAHYDMLTGLINRTLFSDRMHQALVTAQRENKRLAVLYIDLDDFKDINDTLGHGVGDLVLKSAAVRIQSSLRDADSAARFGGDEFIVLLHSIDVAENAVKVAEKIRKAITQPYDAGGHAVTISCSIGVAVFPEHGRNEKTLVRNADNATFAAKNSGRNQVKLHTGTQE